MNLKFRIKLFTYNPTGTRTYFGGHTSTNGSRKVPDRGVPSVGDAGESGVAVQDVARNTAVLHAVSHSETAAATQHRFGWDTRVSTGCAVELCRGTEKKTSFTFSCFLEVLS